VPVAAKPGRPARVDYEYVRNGTANVFMFLDVHREVDPTLRTTRAGR